MRDLEAEAAAWELLERLRWDGPPTCPHCDAPGRSYQLRPANGVRRTRTGAPSPRRVWKCGACRRQFSVLTGTVLEGTRIALTTWIAAVESYAKQGDGPTRVPTALAPAPIRRHLDQVLTTVRELTADPETNRDGGNNAARPSTGTTQH